MKIIRKLALILLTLLIISPAISFPAELEATSGGIILGGNIRVGLTSRYHNLSSVTFHNRTLDIGFERAGQFVFEVRLNIGTTLVASTNQAYYFSVGSYTNFTDASREAQNLRNRGFTAVPASTGIGQWTVYVGGYMSAEAAANDRAALFGTSAPVNTRRVVLTENNIDIVIFDSPTLFPQFSGVGEPVNLGDNSYRGRIELMRIGHQNLTAVNVIGVEEYLFSVVPSEMPHTWPLHALKAQAVASRTYVATRRGFHEAEGFDLCDSAHCCQAYHGSRQEAAQTTRAVNETADIIIWHGGAPIQAVYFASSGGFTDHSENVWVNYRPYLRSVVETHEHEPRVWSRTISLADIDRALAARGANIGAARDMTIRRMENNRVQELLIHGSHANLTLTREEIRTFFAPIPGGALESRNFTITGAGFNPTALTSDVYIVGQGGAATSGNITTFSVRSQDGNILPSASAGEIVTIRSAHGHQAYSTALTGPVPEGSFVLSGLGHGHGVGMSQAGARGMAEAGMTFEQILRHYYRGVDIRR